MDRNLSAFGLASVACLAVCIAICIAVCIVGVSVARAGEGLVDPTRPTSMRAGSGSEAGGLHVEAVILRAGSRVAIVNGRIVRAGDHLGDIVIEEVTAEGVRYLQHGRSAFARLTIASVEVRRALLLGDVP